VVLTVGAEHAYAAVDYRDTLYRDTLQKAVDPPGDIDVNAGDFFNVYAADQESFDNNLFRLPSSVTDVSGAVGANASRQDHINSASAGLDGQWNLGRQIVAVNLRADDNRYARNTDLNNVSSSDKVVWNWALADSLSGQVGADYTRSIASFVNTNVYTRNLVSQAEYFGGARYQVGPRWAIFGGVLQANTRLSALASKANNSDRKSVEFGTEYATGAKDSVGLEYRYTDTTYPNALVATASPFSPDYKEDRARAYVIYALSDKTLVDASAGYLRRDYPSHAVGGYSGAIGRASIQWQPSEKTQLVAVGWRELHAYPTAESDYYVSDGVSVSPIWTASEKINISLLFSSEKQDYIGSTPGIAVEDTRHDKVFAEQVAAIYTPIKFLILNFSIRREQRSSNQNQFEYNDTLAAVGVTGKF